ncbi:MAG: galactosyldiacylglycerol synthase [Clostridia bacterium]|nr:galactosyldiacylglycerol synthase [Clostridia bacterium]
MKALVLSITAGQGHNSTGKALCAYLESIGCEAEMLDTFNYVNRILGETVSRGYLIAASNAKLAYKGAYRLAEKRKKSRTDVSPTRATGSIMAKKLLKYINNYDPDVIICTHIFAGIIMDVLKAKRETRAKTIGILTDFAFHPYWEEGLNLDYVVTPNELITAQALKKGFTPSQILPIGIPIHPKFARSMPKEEARAELGLDLTKRTVLLMSGSMGYGSIEETVRKLDGVPFDFQLITVCGNNAEAKAKIDAMQTKKRILNLGYVNYVDKLMDAADCIISKPGGLTTSEAMAKRLPMIIVDPIPGQEDRNTEFLTNNGAAMAVSHTAPLDEVLYQMLADPRRIEVMRAAIDIIRKPNSTRDICEFAKKIITEKE